MLIIKFVSIILDLPLAITILDLQSSVQTNNNTKFHMFLFIMTPRKKNMEEMLQSPPICYIILHSPFDKYDCMMHGLKNNNLLKYCDSNLLLSQVADCVYM